METNNDETKPIGEYKLNDMVLGHYKIGKVIGHGGMNSVIYLAEDINVPGNDYYASKLKYVAVKVIKKDKDISEKDWSKFWDETTTQSRLVKAHNKKYMPEIFERIVKDDTIYIVMEYINGKQLSRIIHESGHLSINEALFFLKKILLVIKDLHHGYKEIIIHRDLKPENIMVSNDWTEVKIIDFGIATSFGALKESVTKTNEEEIYGTFQYLTPQILELRGKKQKEEKENIIKKIGFQFDFYAIGIIFYEMLTGEKPYKYREEDEDKPSILWYPINYDIPVISKISSVPPEAENIILRLMASKNISTDNHLVIEKDGYEELPDDYVKPYEDVNEIIMEVEKLQKDLNTNNVIELNQKLLKPFNERVFQNSSKMFSIKNEKIKVYDRMWFLITFLSVSITLIIVMIILFHVV